MDVKEAVASLRRMAQQLSERQAFLESHQEEELEQFCGEIEELENDFSRIIDQAEAAADDEADDDYEDEDEDDE